MKFIRNNIIKITFFLITIIVISIIILKNNLKENEVYLNENNGIFNNTIKLEEKEIINEEKYVDIKGEILNPGVFKINDNTRVIDVINMAGGLLDTSDTSKINLAKKVTDEMVIIIYSKEEINKDKIINNINYSFNDALVNEKDLLVKEENNNDNDNDQLININKASKEQLMSLSGIGESKANAIISYREVNGDFKTIEDILNVTGIGNSIYEKIKNYITT